MLLCVSVHARLFLTHARFARVYCVLHSLLHMTSHARQDSMCIMQDKTTCVYVYVYKGCMLDLCVVYVYMYVHVSNLCVRPYRPGRKAYK